MDNRFYYYLHGSTASTPDEIRDILDNGLKSRYKFSLSSTMWRIDGEGDLEEKIKSYSKSEKFDAVFVIKIPKDYLPRKIKGGVVASTPIPFFKKIREKNTSFNAVFTPHLIQGVYVKNSQSFVTNLNFNPIFDPSGLQYSDEQLEFFKNNMGFSPNITQWGVYMGERRSYSFKALRDFDHKHHTFNRVMDDYSKIYGENSKDKK